MIAALRLIAAFAVSFASAAFGLWWLGTSGWSVALAIATFLITLRSMTAPGPRHRARYAREEDPDDYPAA